MPSKPIEKESPALAAAVQRSRKLLNRRALAAAAAGAVPIPGLDWAVDATLVARMVPAINAEFGLTPAQIEQLTPRQRDKVQKAVTMVGSVLIGKTVTQELAIKAIKAIALRLTTAQAAKFVPFAGQAVSAMVGYATVRYLGENHIKDCVRVAQTAGLALPTPSSHPSAKG